jgi:hypothetical protein
VKRREFITLLGGAAATWPLAAHAQQGDKVRRIGVLMNVAVDDPEAPARIGAFSQGLAELGWTIGRDVRIDYRWYAGNAGATVSDRHLPFQSSRSRQSYRVVGRGDDPVDGPLRPHGALERYRDFRQKVVRVRPGAARDRGSAETVPSSSRRALPGRNFLSNH